LKYWEIIADNLSKAGWSWGCVSAVDSSGRTLWIADAHGGDGKRLVVRADESSLRFWNSRRPFAAVANSFDVLKKTLQNSALPKRIFNPKPMTL
jgi:hypothetical protein